ncbi:hypothetical protein F383_20369 [Gossypium arboreum]|uniref:Uncharacterized protein n=1 Tax=Gossypium arboreum TaxID=29729 RepID=A0A0B0MJZ8_GOSAR|nr:hypothetical protein F383_20369 [Gossypium arboreum]
MIGKCLNLETEQTIAFSTTILKVACKLHMPFH